MKGIQLNSYLSLCLGKHSLSSQRDQDTSELNVYTIPGTQLEQIEQWFLYLMIPSICLACLPSFFDVNCLLPALDSCLLSLGDDDDGNNEAVCELSSSSQVEFFSCKEF